MNHTLIVGGGIIGMLTARELALAGEKVTLLDRQDTGRESSWAGGGIVSPLFPWRYLDSVTALASWGQQAYPQLCSSLLQETGIDPEYTGCGLLMIAADETETARNWAEQHQRDLRLIDRDTFQTLEPRAANPPEQAIWMPGVGQLRNPRVVRALRALIEKLGVSIRTYQEVTGLQLNNQQCVGVHTATEHLQADNVVICAGAWSAGLLEHLPSPPDVRPVRGQMLLFKTAPGTITRMVLEKNRYIIPRLDGRVLFGSTIEEVGFAKETTDAARDELYNIATERFPVLKNFPIEKQWAGLRPGSPAGVPYIGAHPGIDNLFINAGHFRNGVVLGAASARLAADLVLQRKPILDPNPYSWTAPRC